jgi:hypothetical protein
MFVLIRDGDEGLRLFFYHHHNLDWNKIAISVDRRKCVGG